MKKTLLIISILLPLINLAQLKKYPPTPDKLYGQLFADVQLQKILPDGKTFVDCTPKRKVADIMYDYGMMKGANMDLKKFIEDNFDMPKTPQLNYVTKEDNATMHIKNLWSVLKRQVDVAKEGSSLLPLPHPYIVPGGRFREIYYWDSYFTMLGLKESGEVVMMENMIKNFEYLINSYGHIPNGNRSYYLSRSQPPYFCMMVDLLASIKGKAVYKRFLPAMLKEYEYWMEGAANVKEGEAYKRVVKLTDDVILNRYWDDNTTPRQESYQQDVETAEQAANELAMLIKVASPEKLKQILDERRAITCRHLRAGACSGWDFSSRWFVDPNKISSIHILDIIPVDLNCLMYSMENVISTAYKASAKTQLAAAFKEKANKRKEAILKYFWNEENSFFYDYNFAINQQTDVISVAGIFPLFMKIATSAQAAAVAKTTEKALLKDGGIVSTVNNNGQQWDAPNGWAPLQWASIKGFGNYNNPLAKTIAKRWLALNDKVFKETGKMMEKYNVEDMSQLAGGGEYPGQDGFGWTNGVYLALKKLYGR